MGEHRRRVHQQMPEEQDIAVPEAQEEPAMHESQPVHRRRLHTEPEPVQADGVQDQPTAQEDALHIQPEAQDPEHHAHRRRQQMEPPKREPELSEGEPVQPDGEPELTQDQPVMAAEEPEKPVNRRTVSGPKKTVSGRKMKKAPKKKGGIFRGIHEWLLAGIVVLGAAGQAIGAGAGKLRTGVAKLVQRLKGKKLPLRSLTMAFLLCVALVSAWQIGSIALRSMRTRRLNDELSERRAQLAEQAQAPGSEEIEWVVFEGETIPASEALAMLESTSTPAPELTPVPVTESNAGGQRENTVNVVSTTKYRHLGGDALPEMAALRAENSDLVAWMQIPDVLDLPVVYRDNDYYLTHDFHKQKNTSGTVFLDEEHPFKEKTQNLLLHGHNMKDGTMFGRLAQYLYDDSYLRNHPFVYFDTLWRKEQYVIFAVLDVSLDPTDGRFFNYFTHDTFSSDAQFTAYIRQLQLRSEYAIPIDVQPDDALLTLSTCLDEDRLVIVARRLREGETRSELRTLIRMATRQ